ISGASAPTATRLGGTPRASPGAGSENPMSARGIRLTVIIAGALLLLAAEGSRFTPPFGPWKRVSRQPILRPRGDAFESAGVFNPAVVKDGGRFVMLYRAQDKYGTSRFGYATSNDGVHFTRNLQPIFVPKMDYEKDGGVEDPRLVKIGGTWYLTYTGYNKHDAQLCLATSRDLIHWQRHGILLPAYKGKWNVKWTKSGAIIPRKIGG